VSLELPQWIKNPTVRTVGIAIFAALSTALNFLTVYMTFWGMKIDLVAVPWVLCWAIFGLEGAFICALIGIPLVSFVGFGVGGLVGGTMKFIASVWMFAVPAIYAFILKSDRFSFLQSYKHFIVAAIIAIIIRDFVTVIFNLYFAVPVFFGMSVDQIGEFFSKSPFVGWLGIAGLAAFIFEVIFWNTVQGAIDLIISGIIGAAVTARLFPGLKKNVSKKLK
jgi:riboflavin transporter FmnP